MAQADPAAPAPRPERLRHTMWWYLKWFFNILALGTFCLTIMLGKVISDMMTAAESINPDLHVLMVANRTEPTRVFAADGSLLAEFKGEERKWVPIESLKRDQNAKGDPGGHLIDATLAIEDTRFYEHVGMDPKRILGALVANITHHSISQGGSTITEQLAKNVYLTQARTMNRRLTTALIALQLERKLSKDEILEAYLNVIYYGNGAYGCEAAAHRYFNKDASNLTIAEAALLAGLPQSPTRLDPFEHFDRAQARQAVVLHEMVKIPNQLISYAEYSDALKDTSVASEIAEAHARYDSGQRRSEHWKYPYFVSYVRQYLEKQYGWSEDYLEKGGLKIYTTIDPQIQDIAEQTLFSHVDALHRPGLQGALVCIDPWNGNIVAMVGGRDYYGAGGQWNRAVQAKRQVGSTMKPYVYATAMEEGLTPDTVLVDSPLYVCGVSECGPGSDESDRHEIKNYDRKHHGAMTLREAIGMSNNVIATRLLLKVGIGNVVDKAHLMGIQSELHPFPTLALGTSELSLLEHVSAYGAFATHGLRADSTPVARVDDYSGDTLVEQPAQVRGSRVLTPQAANYMWELLHYVITNGTGRAADIPGYTVIGKTGTTSSNKDVWFMGATDDLVTGVWMGYDKPRELTDSAGGKWCAPVWKSFMIPTLAIWKSRNPVKQMIEDAKASEAGQLAAAQAKQSVKVRICDDSGLLATAYCPHWHWQVFPNAGDAPTEYCDIPDHQHGSYHYGNGDSDQNDNSDQSDNGGPSPPAKSGSDNTNPYHEDSAGWDDSAGAQKAGAAPAPTAAPAQPPPPSGGGVSELDPNSNSGKVLDENNNPPGGDNFAPPPAPAPTVDPNGLARSQGN